MFRRKLRISHTCQAKDAFRFYVKKDFKDLIYQWVNEPTGDHFMNIAIFYDALCVSGDINMVKDLKAYLKTQKKKIAEASATELLPFAAENAFLIFELWHKIYSELSATPLLKIYTEMELPLANILFQME